jgi:succinate-acetate transporter protein
MTDNNRKEQPMSDAAIHEFKDTTGNPAPLGLLAFGMTTVLLNMHNAGFYEFNSMILAMGIFYGGFAQIVAGAMEWKKNNTFGMTAFSSYGFFGSSSSRLSSCRSWDGQKLLRKREWRVFCRRGEFLLCLCSSGL